MGSVGGIPGSVAVAVGCIVAVGVGVRTPVRVAVGDNVIVALGCPGCVGASVGRAGACTTGTFPQFPVSVTTVEHEHVEPTCLALERGVGVLVEKPIATTVDGAERMVETATRTGAVLVPAHILRFATPHLALRRQVVDGRLGRVLAISARRDRTHA